MYVCMYVCVPNCVVCMHVCMYACVYVCAYDCMDPAVCTNTQRHARTCECNPSTDTHTHTHTHSLKEYACNSCFHTHTHTYTCACNSLLQLAVAEDHGSISDGHGGASCLTRKRAIFRGDLTTAYLQTPATEFKKSCLKKRLHRALRNACGRLCV